MGDIKVLLGNSDLDNRLDLGLEKPRDGGAWWAVVYGVAQSRTRLKWLNMHACIGEGNGNPLLAWRIPRTEEPSGLSSMGLHRVGHNWSDLAAAAAAAADYPFSSGSSQPKNRTRVSYIAGRFFTNWLSGKPIDLSTFSHIKMSYFNAVIEREIFMRVEKLRRETKNSLAETFGILIKCYDCTKPS